METPTAESCPFCHATTANFLEVVDDAAPEAPWVPLVETAGQMIGSAAGTAQSPKKRRGRPRWLVWHKYNGCHMGPRTWDLKWWNERGQP